MSVDVGAITEESENHGIMMATGWGKRTKTKPQHKQVKRNMYEYEFSSFGHVVRYISINKNIIYIYTYNLKNTIR